MGQHCVWHERVQGFQLLFINVKYCIGGHGFASGDEAGPVRGGERRVFIEVRGGFLYAKDIVIYRVCGI